MDFDVTVDDELFETAKGLTGIIDPDARLNAALRALIEQQSARRLAMLAVRIHS